MMHETPLDLSHVTLTDRALIVCDIDEVVLEFLTPFRNYLRAMDHDLLPRSFRLHGNIVHTVTGSLMAEEDVSQQLERFFSLQGTWQTPAERAIDTLADLSRDADIVFLTAMPPRHTDVRRALLDSHGLCYPLLATEAPKGPVVKRLHDARDVPVVFLDDILRNLHSVREHAPECLLVNLMANIEFRRMAPDPGDGILKAEGWEDAARLIRAHLG